MDEFHSQILLISGMAKDFIAKNGVNASSAGITEHITGVKLPLLQLPKVFKKCVVSKFKLAPFNSSDNDHSVLINAWTINTVCAPLAAVKVDVKRCDHLRNLQLADTFPRGALSLDRVVGVDQYYKLVQGDMRKGRPGTPIATKSRLGWLLSGPEEVTAVLNVTKRDSLDNQLKRFSELNAIGIVNHQEHQRTVKEEDEVNQFNSCCRFDGQRYEVGPP